MSSFLSKNISLREELDIKDEEFVQLRDFIYQITGIFIGDNRKYLLKNRLANRLKENSLKSFGEYLYFLKYDPGRKNELNRLFEVITTNETSFYRNPPQLKVFQEIILKKIIEDKRSRSDRSLHIWSAGCSTGEEPYTLAMILYESLRQEISSWRARITANDLSPGVLAAAEKGVYSSYSLRTTPPEMVKRYFHAEESGLFRISNRVKKLVDFHQLNLSDRLQLKRVPRSDVIFCRNVIIYFDDEMKKNVISSFYDNLYPGGYLFIGHSESLHNISRAFRPAHYPGSIVYLKEG
ncbi:MAG: CheR family methyltransferase [Desulfonatronovibrionaceae bacterium]